ncbi:CAP domain-containing protein [Candidatus Parcubacteria bacterium]|jgi:hypothetical protein|nr:CAP domain-containing protein [Candidatus Parcubacteria bacterium]
MPNKKNNKNLGKDSIDSDADGLLDKEEQKIGTDPRDPDSDHDALGDYQEVNVYETDPLDPDTDRDGVEDGVEVMLGRNPKGAGKLSDLFIPTRHNNYRPKALHPKRLAFHAISAVAIKVIMVGFLMSFPVHAWLSPDVLYTQSKKIVALTNNIRTNLNIHTLQESPVLQTAALAKAQDMMINEYFAHTSPDNRSLKNWLFDADYSFRVAGENLALGFSNPEDVVNAWVKSPTHYANMVDTDFTEIGVAMVSGNYQGYDTSLAAQYFGDPKVVPVVEIEPEEVAVLETVGELVDNIEIVEKEKEVLDNSRTNEEEIVVITEPEEDVLAEKEENIQEIVIPLVIPKLLNPSTNSINSGNNINLEISAPNAESLAILDHGQEIAAFDVLNDSVITELNLEEGEHIISLKSYRGIEVMLSGNYTLNIDNTAPEVDENATKVLVNRPLGQEDIVFKATAYLSDDTESAHIKFDDYTLALTRDFSEEGKWTGNKIVSDIDYEKLFNPLVLASLTAVDVAGNTTIKDVNWDNITPVKNSTVNQYVFLKNNQSEFIKPLFDLSSIYYQVILTLAIIALLLSIFIEVRKQHPHTIASTIGVIVLLVFLTIF